MAGIMSPPSSFSIILQKGLAAHVERSSLASPALSSGLHAPTLMQPTSSMTADQSPYDLSHGTPSADVGSNLVGKKKRGRPRKYAEDKKGRGQPLGSGKKQQLAALGAAGAGFTPHVIIVAAGEDIAMRVRSLSQIGPRTVCILSANGTISNVTLQQPTTTGGTITYEGHFEILSLSGSFFPTKNLCVSNRTGGLSVSLAGPEGQVVGGGVAGLLMAASPVQMVVGSFLSCQKKSQTKSEGLPKSRNVKSSAAVPMAHETAVVANADSPSLDAHELQNYDGAGRSFTSLLETGTTDINVSLSGE